MRRRVITPIDAPEQFQEEARVQRRERETVKTSALLRALGLAHYWQRLLDEGKYLRIPVNVTDDSGNVTGIPAIVTDGWCCAI